MSRRHVPEPSLIALVAAGGMLGTAGRYLVGSVLPAGSGWPTATFAVNVVGSFLLGALLEALLRRGDESRRGRLVRLGLGTGVLGSFTTFSSLAIETERLLAHGDVALAVTYVAASVGAGLAACVLGVVLGSRHHRVRGSATREGTKAHGRPTHPGGDTRPPAGLRSGRELP